MSIKFRRAIWSSSDPTLVVRSFPAGPMRFFRLRTKIAPGFSVFVTFPVEKMTFSIEILSFFIKILGFSIEIMNLFIKILSFSIEIFSFSIEKVTFFSVLSFLF